MNKNPFLVTKDGKQYDYREGHELPVESVTTELNARGYAVKKLELLSRHYTGVVIKDDTEYFIKVATSIGMSVVTEHDARWNRLVAEKVRSQKLLFSVPIPHDTGYLLGDYFFMVTDFINGKLLVNYPFDTNLGLLEKHWQKVVDIALSIEGLQLSEELIRPEASGMTSEERYLRKTQSHFDTIPDTVREKYDLDTVLTFVKMHLSTAQQSTAHGDFTPWHLFVDEKENFTLIDGEHASTQAPENYDVGYVIQRVYSVLKNPKLAKKMLQKALDQGVDGDRLQVILAMRAIGGFLDESLAPNPDYTFHKEFVEQIVRL